LQVFNFLNGVFIFLLLVCVQQSHCVLVQSEVNGTDAIHEHSLFFYLQVIDVNQFLQIRAKYLLENTSLPNCKVAFEILVENIKKFANVVGYQTIFKNGDQRRFLIEKYLIYGPIIEKFFLYHEFGRVHLKSRLAEAVQEFVGKFNCGQLKLYRFSLSAGWTC
jgi:hypothetical protein